MSTVESIEESGREPNLGAGRALTLGVDIGGTNVKASVMDRQWAGAEQVRTPTPKPATPKAVLKAIEELVGRLPSFNRISVDFPGWCDGTTNCPNLAPSIGRVSVDECCRANLPLPCEC
jgi:predicted NBD/HSP70 family sugar kinase